MGGRKLGWSGFAYLRNSYFPQDWALEMAEKWALDSKDGFFWDVPLSTVALKDFESVSRDFTTRAYCQYLRSGATQEVQLALGDPDRTGSIQQGWQALG